MRLKFIPLIAVSALMLGACDTPRDISYIRASDLDNAGRHTEAAKLYRFVASSEEYSGRQAAEFRLADMHLKGEGVPKNEAEGLRLMQQAAQGPDASWRRLANYRLGDLNENGIPGHLERNRPAALRYFQTAAADGENLSKTRITNLESYPDVIVELNKSEYMGRASSPSPGGMARAYDLLKASQYEQALPIISFHARNGSSEAQFALSLMYKNGWGLPRDEMRVKGWCFMAAQNGHRAAQRELGWLLYENEHLLDGDEEVEMWLKRAADQGDVEAVNLLGILVLHPVSKARKPDPALALSYFEAASKNGSAAALSNLGDLYTGRNGIPRDAERSKAYYISAIDAGYTDARTSLFKEHNITYDAKAAKGPKAAGNPPTQTDLQQVSAAATPARPILPQPSTMPASLPAATTAPVKPSLVELFATLSPSVVQIIALNIKAGRTDDASQGSGVIIRPDLILTNCHVLEGTNTVGTKLNGKVLLFKLAGGNKRLDLCLLRSTQSLKQVSKSRNFDSLKVGEKVFAIGSPSGLQNTVTEGIISGLRRSGGVRYIQTSTPISPGSSGGGLFDENGNLIGITTFKLDGDNLNFAVAIDESEPIIAKAR